MKGNKLSHLLGRFYNFCWNQLSSFSILPAVIENNSLFWTEEVNAEISVYELSHIPKLSTARMLKTFKFTILLLDFIFQKIYGDSKAHDTNDGGSFFARVFLQNELLSKGISELCTIYVKCTNFSSKEVSVSDRCARVGWHDHVFEWPTFLQEYLLYLTCTAQFK